MELIVGKNGIELIHKSGNWLLTKELGYSPVEMIAASVGGCSAYVYQALLEKVGIAYTIEKVLVSYERDAEKRAEPISKIEVVFYLVIAEQQQAEATKLLENIAKNCPVISSLNSNVVVQEQAVFVK